MSELILLVEDDQAIAEMITDALARHGFEFTRARDAAEAAIAPTRCPVSR